MNAVSVTECQSPSTLMAIPIMIFANITVTPAAVSHVVDDHDHCDVSTSEVTLAVNFD